MHWILSLFNIKNCALIEQSNSILFKISAFVFTIIYFIYLCIINWNSINHFYSVIYLLSSIPFIYALSFYFIKKYFNISSSILLIFFASVLYNLYIHHHSAVHVIISFAIPLISFALFKVKNALFICTGSLITIIFSAVWSNPSHTSSDQSPILQTSALFFAYSTLMFFYERNNFNNSRKLDSEIKKHDQVSRLLGKAKERAEKLFTIVPSAIVTFDSCGCITSFNKKAEEITGYKSSEVLLKKVPLFQPSHHSPQQSVRDGLIQSLRNKECKLICRDGTDKIILKNVETIYSETLEPIGSIESFVDISFQKKIETELRTAKQNAEEAGNKAIEASLSKSAFLANMSHEIRTPMNGIIGMITLLLETKLSAEQKEFVDNIKFSADSLLQIINDILDISKIEAGKLELDIISFDIRTTIERSLDLVVYRALDKNIELISLISCSLPSVVEGDPGRIRQIIINLVNNAIKFTDKGEVFISVSIKNETDNYVELYFSIRDTGIGISQEGKERLFKSFSQVDSSMTRKFGGTGLGLSISKKLAELMHGEIGVESTLGEGSTFWFTARFPIKKNQKNQQLASVSPIPLRILIVEPYKTSQEVLRHYIESFQHQCEFVEDSATAIKMLRSNKSNTTDPYDVYSVVIINNNLFSVSGLQLATLIRADSHFNDLKIIILTDIGKRGDATHMKKVGVNGYLIKPVKQKQLFECIELVRMHNNYNPDDTDNLMPAVPLVTQHSIAEEQNRQNVRILLAEDNLVNQKVAIKLLEKLGYSCEIAKNGMEAVEAQSKNKYNLIFMDCQMPILSGFDATRAIREEEIKKNINDPVPIIAMTANALKGDKEKCLESGMNDYLSKPLNFKELSDMLNKWISVNHHEPTIQI